MSRVRISVLIASLALGTAAGAQTHRLEPAELDQGGTATYVLEQVELASVEAARAVTVHAPAGDGLELLGSSLELVVLPRGVVRRDRFLLRAGRPGEIAVKPAVLEGPDGTAVGQEDLVLRVRAPHGGDDRSFWFGLAGLVLLLPAFQLAWRRGAGKQDVELEDGGAGSVEAEDPLAAPREARLRGDGRDFYVALYAALRAGVRGASGRSPRDPKGLARTAEDAGLSPRLAGQLRDLATRCERVVFGGETAPPDELAESYRRAEAVLAALGENNRNEEDPA
jgi:hypothetical protein